MKNTKRNLGAGRLLYLAVSVLFLFFLVYSTPHRVHHSFSQPLSGPCPVFSIAKGCHLQPVSEIQLPVIEVTIEGTTLSPEVWVPYLTSIPFPIRAPPGA